MPRRGFKSITVSEQVYNHFYQSYKGREKVLASKGISSFTRYVTDILEELMERDDIFARYAPFMHEIAIEGDTIILWDNKLGKSAEVVLRDRELFCRLDESNNCVHVGFAYSIPKIYPIMTERGVKLSKG